MRDKILAKVEAYYEIELKECATLEKYCKKYHKDLKAYKDATIQRGLGVAFFVQTLGVEYKVIDKIYTDFKEKVDKM